MEVLKSAVMLRKVLFFPFYVSHFPVQLGWKDKKEFNWEEKIWCFQAAFWCLQVLYISCIKRWSPKKKRLILFPYLLEISLFGGENITGNLHLDYTTVLQFYAGKTPTFSCIGSRLDIYKRLLNRGAVSMLIFPKKGKNNPALFYSSERE